MEVPESPNGENRGFSRQISKFDCLAERGLYPISTERGKQESSVKMDKINDESSSCQEPYEDVGHLRGDSNAGSYINPKYFERGTFNSHSVQQSFDVREGLLGKHDRFASIGTSF